MFIIRQFRKCRLLKSHISDGVIQVKVEALNKKTNKHFTLISRKNRLQTF